MATHIAKISASINTSGWENFANVCQDALDASQLIFTRIRPKYNKRVKFNLELIAERAVEVFYESYDPPHVYSRQEGLLKAFKVIATNDEWSLETGAEYIQASYRVGTDYVFENSFVRGYHGGAIGGPKHPSPGTPWWKLYGKWYKPATKGPAPEDLINKEVDNYLEEAEQAYGDEAVDFIKPYIDKARIALNRIVL